MLLYRGRSGGGGTSTDIQTFAAARGNERCVSSTYNLRWADDGKQSSRKKNRGERRALT